MNPKIKFIHKEIIIQTIQSKEIENSTSKIFIQLAEKIFNLKFIEIILPGTGIEGCAYLDSYYDYNNHLKFIPVGIGIRNFNDLYTIMHEISHLIIAHYLPIFHHRSTDPNLEYVTDYVARLCLRQNNYNLKAFLYVVNTEGPLVALKAKNKEKNKEAIKFIKKTNIYKKFEIKYLELCNQIPD